MKDLQSVMMSRCPFGVLSSVCLRSRFVEFYWSLQDALSGSAECLSIYVHEAFSSVHLWRVSVIKQ